MKLGKDCKIESEYELDIEVVNLIDFEAVDSFLDVFENYAKCVFGNFADYGGALEGYLLFGTSFPPDEVYLLQHYMHNHFLRMNYPYLAAAAILFTAFLVVVICVVRVLMTRFIKYRHGLRDGHNWEERESGGLFLAIICVTVYWMYQNEKNEKKMLLFQHARLVED